MTDTEKSGGSLTRVEPDPASGGLRVTIALEGSPLHYVLSLGRYPGGGDKLVCRAVSVEPPQGSTEPVAVTAPVLRELADRFDRLEQHARTTAAVVFGGNGQEAAPAVRTRRELSPAFLADVVRRHTEYRDAGLPPTQTLAREERVSTGTVKHWLRRARQAGIGETS
jgi:hypothetical protein